MVHVCLLSGGIQTSLLPCADINRADFIFIQLIARFNKHAYFSFKR